jgi:NAD-dependent dihydropyrimidine dehydrogenase PreA subunit
MSDTKCKDESQQWMPVVDFNKCEAKGPCIEVCPYDIFEIRTITEPEFKKLSFIGRLKTRAHGNKKAYVVHPADCHTCGYCVTACPEKAIKLVRYTV